MNYFRAHQLDAALQQLASRPLRIVCGATDCYAETGAPPTQTDWLDISLIDALRGISQQGEELRIGAATSWDCIDRSELLPASLREAAHSIGSLQIRLQGTIGGNLCHASPVADGVPALLSLGACVELASVSGVRRLPLEQFLLGRRSTALRPDEILSAVLFDASQVAQPSAFVKLTNRDGTALAVVSTAVRLRWQPQGVLAQAFIAVGGASEVPARLRSLEEDMEGLRAEDLLRAVQAATLAELAPIDDCRGGAAQRLQLARVALERALARCLESGE
ncbi:FAD binding domain-containing protein [Paucibacter sp. R3-3]|uniref:FAD binding domain-containing protein n=1 Tax=Roseateles agri TaxID=3098619 RepID=A0ABU5DMC9_9BURK|nr:FAD binding domain-containing protein [Paucibacter sp. R3-3]MDY0746883.1 FAD binding domain-containing protein [Paucibacter sp. R3-3]